MFLTIEPRALHGSVRVPPSKSLSHRAVIAAALADGESLVENLVFSQDIEATCDAIEAFGRVVERGSDFVRIRGEGPLAAPGRPIDCRESGSTLRFLIPFAGLVGAPVEFRGSGELPRRPLGPYLDLFREKGIGFAYDGALPLTVDGRLSSGEFRLPGNVSSQFITGLLFVLPLLDGPSRILVEGPLESSDYIDLTIRAMADFGVSVRRVDPTADSNGTISFEVEGGQAYRPTRYRVEGDYSQAAFWIAAGLCSGDAAGLCSGDAAGLCSGDAAGLSSGRALTLLDLRRDSLQGDRRILDIAQAMGGNLRWTDESTLVVEASATHGTTVDAAQCPDLVPAVAALAAVSEGKTSIINAGRVRIKESDRLKAIATEINRLGGAIRELPEGLEIEGRPGLSGGPVDGWNDHRIVMSLAAISARCAHPLTIEGAEAVRKSYPHFFEDFRSLGGIAE